MNRTGIFISRLLLAGLFLVFNVGLPILVNSCTMPKPAGSMMCPFCHEYDGVGVVIKGKPCCSSSIAAERNTNEFLSVGKLPGFHPAPPCAAIYSVGPLVSFSAVPGVPRLHQSQVPPDDIPVLHSSLLI
jgi:hypothetical protein